MGVSDLLMFARLAAFAASFIVATGCATTTGSGSPIGVRWVPHPDDPDVLLEPAKRLAAEIVATDRCRVELEALPGWPVGDLRVRTVDSWPEGYAENVAARTLWRNESDEHYAIDPRVEILTSVVVSRSVAAVATILVHETVHAATGPHNYAGDDESLAQRITGLCARAYGLLYVPTGVAQN